MQIGQLVVGRYYLEAELGRGGMGVVYRAEDRVLGRRVALKAMTAALQQDPVARGRFLREARALAGLANPHVVSVYDVDPGAAFLTMELLEGGDLRRSLEGHRRLHLDQVADLASQIADGLDAVHAAGLVHRDIKPANVLLKNDGRPVLADFGLALPADGSSALTTPGGVVGTPHYLSPEQLGGRPATRASDVYAFGCLLFHCLTGRPPFTGSNEHEVVNHHRHSPVPDARSLVPDLPEQAQEVLARCLAKDPRNRYPSAGAAAAALRHSIALEPRTTQLLEPRTTQLPLPEPARRLPRGLLAACGAVVVVAAVGGGAAGMAGVGRTADADGATTGEAMSQPSGPADPQARLRALLPPEVYGTTCAPLEHRSEVVAAIKCTAVPGGGVNEVLVLQWRSPEAMKADFGTSYVRNPRYTQGRCSEGTGKHSTWLRDGATAGGLACGSNNNQHATLTWEDDALAVQMIAVRFDKDAAKLYAWWDPARKVPLR